jgi:hypothetical protein
MTTLTSTLYLATDSTTNPPIVSSNKASVSWVVDWDMLFHGRTGLCKIHTNLLSKSATVSAITTSWNGLIGTVRANFQSIYSNNQNNVILANLTPNSVAGSSTVFYYTAQSEHAQPTINIPQGKTNISIQLLDTTEANLISGVPDYEIMLFFEWISSDVVKENIK